MRILSKCPSASSGRLLPRNGRTQLSIIKKACFTSGYLFLFWVCFPFLRDHECPDISNPSKGTYSICRRSSEKITFPPRSSSQSPKIGHGGGYCCPALICCAICILGHAPLAGLTPHRGLGHHPTGGYPRARGRKTHQGQTPSGQRQLQERSPTTPGGTPTIKKNTPQGGRNSKEHPPGRATHQKLSPIALGLPDPIALFGVRDHRGYLPPADGASQCLSCPSREGGGVPQV